MATAYPQPEVEVTEKPHHTAKDTVLVRTLVRIGSNNADEVCGMSTDAAAHHVKLKQVEYVRPVSPKK